MRRRWCIVAGYFVAFVLQLVPAPAAAQESSGSAFLIETAGATVGSAAGFGLALAVSRPDECSGDDLACTLEKIGVSLLVSAAGATLGDVLTGRMSETRPSTVGAALGSLAGIVAGVGFVHLLSEELDVTRNDAALFVSYSLTQGMVTALGSRIGAWIRD